MTIQITKIVSIFAFSFICFSKTNATTIYVSSIAGGSDNGLTWASAFVDLQDALAASQYGDEIWVASGIYRPTTTTNRNISFEIPNGIKLYGGFLGSETSLNQRDWQLNQTILSGDIGVVGDATDNAYTVVYMTDMDSSSVFDGFTIVDGNANANSANEPVTARSKSGGGVYITSNDMNIATAPKISNCKFNGNNAAWNGGALYIFNKQNFIVNPFFESCMFSTNSSKLGGAVSIYGGNDGDNLVFKNCIFEANFAFNGAGMHYYNLYGTHQLVLDSCLFDVNFADDSGGGYFQEVTNPNETQLLLSNCMFSNNSANGGGAIASISFVDSSKMLIQRSLFHDNFAYEGGSIQSIYDKISIFSTEFNRELGVATAASIYANESSVNIYDCIFNRCICNEGQLLAIGSSNALDTFRIINSTFFNNEISLGILTIVDYFNYSIVNSVFWGNALSAQGKVFSSNQNPFYANIYKCVFDVPNSSYLMPNPATFGSGNIYNLDPQFADPENGDFRLHPCSPARNAGSNAIVDSLGILTDIEGSPRIQGGIVDMGAYESPVFQAISATVTSQPCNGAGDGIVALTLENGCPPFFLNWGADSIFSDTSLAVIGLPVGTHSITITDGRMESDTIDVTLTAAPAITGSATATNVACPSGTGTSLGGVASIEAVGGTGAFSFMWSNGASTATVTNLTAGPTGASVYQVTVTDANGCTFTDSVTVGTVGSLTLGINISPITCAGDSDGSATIQPIGGTAPFTWLWQNGEDSPILDSLSGGSYAVTVTDALGCTGDIDFTVNPPTVVTVSVSAMNPPCYGGLGTAIASTTGGTGSFQYAWDNGAMTSSTMLTAGLHTVSATDAHGCTGTDTVTVTAPPALTVNVSPEPPTLCFGASDGALNVAASGGTPPYEWGAPIENLPAGNYIVTLTDSNGCSATGGATIAEHPEITVMDTIVNASSPMASDGSITLTSVLGGTGSGYSFMWDNGVTSQNLTGVPTGEYSLTVTDLQDCTAHFSFFVDFETAAGEVEGNPFGAVIVPNPSSSDKARLLLQQPIPGLDMWVMDAQGRMVSSGVLTSSGFALPNGLAAGTYWVVLDNGEKKTLLRWTVLR